MKVPFSANNPKSINCNANRNPAIGSPHEPKSVLDLRASPSPTTDQKQASNASADNIIGAVCDDALQLEEDHALINQHLEDWDSLMRELGLHDDSISNSPVSKHIVSVHYDSDGARVAQNQYSNLTEFPQISAFDSINFVPADFGVVVSDAPATYTSAGDLSTGNWGVGFDYVDELIRLAECFDTNSLQLGHVVLARLNQRLRSPLGKPFQRAAFFFKEALQSLLTGSNPISRPASSSEIIQTIKAQKTFSSISPITMFSSFTANQAVIDALDDSIHVHIIDFDIGFGGHWASFMRELADKSYSFKSTPPALRISALVLDDYVVESRLVRENLNQFAREMNIRFDIEFVLIRTFEFLSFKSIKFMDNERVVVITSPAVFRHIGTGFLNDLRRISPHVVVHVDTEVQMTSGSPSYRQIVIDGLEFYSTLMESLEAVNFNGGGDWMRRIETFLLFPKILEAMEAVGRRATPLKEALAASGLKQIGFSQFAEFQAECLLRRIQVRGFNVVKRQAEMLLCWHDRPLVSTSAWRY